jgi:peptide/nickel transport system permease protein
MIRYAGGRVLQLIPTLLGMSILIFALVRLLPGDVTSVLNSGTGAPSAAQRAAARSQLGLDKPFVVQYWHFLTGFFNGQLGKSFLSGQSVASILGHAVPITLELTLLGTVIAVAVGVPLGVLSAVRRNSAVDVISRVGGLIGLSLPNFWIATLLLLFTSSVFQWAPSVTWVPLWRDPAGNLAQMVIPAFAVSLYLLAAVMRMTRASMLEVLGEDYVRTARAKGAGVRQTVLRHALRNSLIPVVTLVGAQVGNLMGGSTVVEVIFGFPGVGNTLVQATYNRDYPVVEVTAVFLATVFVVINLIVDLLYGILDPRIEQ